MRALGCLVIIAACLSTARADVYVTRKLETNGLPALSANGKWIALPEVREQSAECDSVAVSIWRVGADLGVEEPDEKDVTYYGLGTVCNKTQVDRSQLKALNKRLKKGRFSSVGGGGGDGSRRAEVDPGILLEVYLRDGKVTLVVSEAGKAVATRPLAYSDARIYDTVLVRSDEKSYVYAELALEYSEGGGVWTIIPLP